MSAPLQVNVFAALAVRPGLRREPVTVGRVVVVEGRRVTGERLRRGARLAAERPADAEELQELALDEAALRRERKRAYYRERHARRKADPVYRAKRRAWYVANKEKVRAVAAEWARRHPERVREQKAAHAQRKRLFGSAEAVAAMREANRRYYAANREVILAKARERRQQRAAERAAKAAPLDERTLQRRERQRAWYAANRERQLELARARRAAAGGDGK